MSEKRFKFFRKRKKVVPVEEQIFNIEEILDNDDITDMFFEYNYSYIYQHR